MTPQTLSIVGSDVTRQSVRCFIEVWGLAVSLLEDPLLAMLLSDRKVRAAVLFSFRF
jgi:hypothetical protein